MTEGNSRIMLAGLIFACISLTACTTSGAGQESDEDQVKRRAQERLDAMLVGDVEKALVYTTPAFRQSISATQYRSRYAGMANWTAADVDAVACQDGRCEVKVSITYQMVRPRMENTRSLDQVWIPVDGQWYIYER